MNNAKARGLLPLSASTLLRGQTFLVAAVALAVAGLISSSIARKQLSRAEQHSQHLRS